MTLAQASRLLAALERRRRAALACALAAPLALLLCASCADSARYGALKRLIYETPGRDVWQKPDEVVQALGLRGGEHVADLGAGGGYFTFRLASAVGGGGRVYAIDMDGALLAYVAAQARTRGLTQVSTVQASASEPNLPAESVDLIFLANVFHHLPAPASYFGRLRSALRPGGRIAIVEAMPESGHRSHATAGEVIAAEMQEAGFVRVSSHGFLPRQSYQVFEPSAH